MKKKWGIADDAWASLLPDLLLDIFRRLESTAVIRCAGACKPWRRAIISNASSLRPCPDRFNPNLLLGFFHRTWDDDEEGAADARPRAIVSVTAVDTGHCESLSSLLPAASAAGVDDMASSSQRILSSRDGWVLLVLRRGPNQQYELCLCNPMAARRECTFFPLPSIMQTCDFTLLSADDLSSPGNGNRDEQRSVRILAKAGTLVLCTEDNRLTYQVFSCAGGAGGDGAGIWGPVRRSDEVDNGLQMTTYGHAVVARDAVYWLAAPKSSPGLITCTVGLDICTGRAWSTQLPRQHKFFVTNITPYVLTTSGNGGLSLLQPVPDHHRDIQVWVLGDGGGGGGDAAMEWTVQHKISIHVPEHPADDNPGFLCTIAVCPRSGFLLNVLLSGRQQRINLDSRASESACAAYWQERPISD